MDLNLKIQYDELLELIRQLPAGQLEKLKKDLSKLANNKNIKETNTPFQKLLLSGPVMDDKQYEQFLSTREFFNK